MINKTLKLFVLAMVACGAFGMVTTSPVIYAKAKVAKEKHFNKAGKAVKDKSPSFDMKKYKGEGDVAKNKFFSPDEQKTIYDYFHGDYYHPSVSLPPGIAKNLARGKPLPPGIAKTRVPSDLLDLLPGRDYWDYWMVGNNIIKVDRSTAIITDIIENILR